jgi:hypothetical protein
VRLDEVFVIRESGSSVSVSLDIEEQELIIRAFDLLDKQVSVDERKKMESLVDKFVQRDQKVAAGKAGDTAASDVQLPAHAKGPLKNSVER